MKKTGQAIMSSPYLYIQDPRRVKLPKVQQKIIQLLDKTVKHC